MQPNDSATQEGFANDDGSNELEQRDVRALRECMTVLPEGGDVHEVVTESGSSYTVDSREGRCTCKDHQYRDTRCKYIRRVAYATGDRPIPAWVDTDGVDPLLGEHTDGSPLVAATDGGATVVPDDVDDGDECQCDGLGELPCFSCFKRETSHKTDNVCEEDE